MILHVLLICAVVVRLVIATSASFDIFSLNCKNQVHFMPEHPVGGISFEFRGLLDNWATKAWAETKFSLACACPDLPDQEIRRAFWPYLFFGLNFLSGSQGGNHAYPLQCDAEVIDTLLNTGQSGVFSLASFPSTCTPYGTGNGAACLVKLPMNQGALTFQVAVGTCFDQPEQPYVAVRCEGADCVNFLKPCSYGGSTLAQCGGLSCTRVAKVARLSGDSLLGYAYSDTLMSGWPDACPLMPEQLARLQSFISGLMSGSSIPAPTSGDLNLAYCLPLSRAKADLTTSSNNWWSLGFNTVMADMFKGTVLTEGVGSVVSASNMEAFAWDGKLDDGEDVLSPARQNGMTSIQRAPLPTSSSAHVWVSVTCDGGFNFLPENPILSLEGKFRIMPLLQEAADIVHDVFFCRAKRYYGFEGATENQYLARMLGMINLFALTSDFDPAVTSIRGSWNMPDWAIDAQTHVNLPESCSLDRWLAFGECSATYNGLSSLLGEQTDVRISIKQCPSNSELPSIGNSLHIECEGAGCMAIREIKTCQFTSDCDYGFICYDLNDIHESCSNGVRDWDEVSKDCGGHCAGSSCSSFSGAPEYSAIGMHESFGWVAALNGFNSLKKTSNRCGPVLMSEFESALRWMHRALGDDANAAKLHPPIPKLCIPDNFGSQSPLSNWANGLYTARENQYSIVGLSSWTAPEPPPPKSTDAYSGTVDQETIDWGPSDGVTHDNRNGKSVKTIPNSGNAIGLGFVSGAFLFSFLY